MPVRLAPVSSLYNSSSFSLIRSGSEYFRRMCSVRYSPGGTSISWIMFLTICRRSGRPNMITERVLYNGSIRIFGRNSIPGTSRKPSPTLSSISRGSAYLSLTTSYSDATASSMSSRSIHSSIFAMSSAAARTMIHLRRNSGISTTGPRVVPTTTDEPTLLLPPPDVVLGRCWLLELRAALRPCVSPSSIRSICTISDGSPTRTLTIFVTACSDAGISNC